MIKANRNTEYAVLHCGVFLVFDLNTKIKPFIKNFYEKLAFNFSMFKLYMNMIHWTVLFLHKHSGGSNLVHWGGWWRPETWLPPWTGTRAAPGRRSLAGSESVAAILGEAGILKSSNISKP